MIDDFGKFKTFVEDCSEVDLYFTIDYLRASLYEAIKAINESNSDKEALKGDVNKMECMAECAIGQTVRFGVSTPREDNGRVTSEYGKWYSWWEKWKKTMANDEWRLLHDKRSKDEDISEFLPNGKWSD